MPPKKQKYVKKNPIDHILDRPDMYSGSTRPRNVEDYVVTDDNWHIERRSVNISPAILRIFVEPLSNIIDNVARSKQSKNVTKISVDIDEKEGRITFWNDGEVIPIEIHEEEKCYNHTMIFGHLMTSSNYDDEEDREDISGRNGVGVKLSNVFSKEFTVEGLDPSNKKQFKQTWKNNMRDPGEPVVKKATKGKGFTKISFVPDFPRFEIEGLTEDILSVYRRYLADAAMITKVPVYFNGEEIPVHSLVDYAKLYSKKKNEESEDEDKNESLLIKTKDCEVVLTPTYSDCQTISFANGVFTPLGGTHVDAWSEALFRPLVEKLNKPKKPQINIGDVRKCFRLFVVATVKKPEFESQSKLKLEAPEIKAEVKKTHLAAINKWSVMDLLEDMIRAKELIVLKKAERKKRGYQRVEGLDPANNEGGTKGRDCTLILVEGLSAKTYASWGIEKGAFGRSGRDWFGIYALRGKCLNCRNAKPLTISKNNVIRDIIASLGVEIGLDYTLEENFKKLRYGRVMILTDADVDGNHISGLIQNMFHSLFPSLLKRNPPFITAMQTPIVRVYRGKTDILFYDEDEYKKYVQENSGKKINKKYYKGIGSSNQTDVEETFGQKLIEFVEDEHTTETMNKVFHTKFTDARKKWLEQYNPANKVIRWTDNEPEIKRVTFSQYIDTEMIKFSIDDCKRSIPSLMDGLKEGHRKVLYVTLLRNLKYTGKVIKVAQLAGAVSEKSGYHHGEQNLYLTITNMGNAYVGSNNIPLLFRDGQFGSREQGGKDAASARYIWTKLDAVTRLIFREEDDNLLEHVEDDGDKVEPRYYVPILPMILVNGCLGIGTGWSSSIPAYNPLELVDCIKAWLEAGNRAFDEQEDVRIALLPEIKPWYRGHTGEMTCDEPGKYTSWGCIERDDKKGKVRVTELPVGLWTCDFVDMLEKMKEEKEISGYKNKSTPAKIDFLISESKDGSECNEKTLKLYTHFRTSNMVLFDGNGRLKKYSTVEEIIDEFCTVRYRYYILRKARQLSDLKKELKILGNKKRFLQEVRDGTIKLFEEKNGKKQSRTTSDLVKELEKRKYDKVEQGDEETETEEDEKKDKKGHGYEYLLRMQINSITAEKINKLENDIANRQSEYDTLEATTEKELWLRDLDEFVATYEKWYPTIEDGGSIKKGKGKKGK